MSEKVCVTKEQLEYIKSFEVLDDILKLVRSKESVVIISNLTFEQVYDVFLGNYELYDPKVLVEEQFKNYKNSLKNRGASRVDRISEIKGSIDTILYLNKVFNLGLDLK